MKKILLVAMTAFSLVIPFNVENCYANSLSYANEIVVEEYKAKENFGAKVEFVDEKLVNKEIMTRGAIVPVYSHSYYVYDYSTITLYDSGPRKNDTFLISVAAGEKLSLESTKTVKGSVTFSRTVSADVKKVINLGLGLTVDGSYSYSWKKGTSFTGATGEGYNYYSIYGAINYDTHTCYVKRYDVYNNVDKASGKITGTYDDYMGTTPYTDVKKPKAIKYSVGGKV